MGRSAQRRPLPSSPADESRGPRRAVLLSVNLGLPRDVDWQGRTVHTGAWKSPVDGPVMARRLNLDGDGQGDLAGHGGEQRAVLVYQDASYAHWRRHFGRDDLGYGAFGENLTVDGLPDDEVCIGDRYRIGEAEFEVTQPRVTCYRVGLRVGEPQMAALLVGYHRPGFYMRVIREGTIRSGDEIVQTAWGKGALTVTETDALLYLPGRDIARIQVAAGIAALSPGWRDSFADMLRAPEGTESAAAPSGPAWSGFRPLRVTRVEPETATVTSVYLASPDGVPLPTARAGQYLTLRVPGAGTPAPVRSYSLSAAPGDVGYRISVKREPHGTVSGYLTTLLRPGAVLDAAAPRGEFVLGDGDQPVLLISAGIGLTPVLAMLHALAAQGGRRPVWWIHGARGPAEHPLAAEARALLASLPHARAYLFYSAATPAEASRAGAVPGRVTAAALAELSLPPDAIAYVCGPAAFTSAMRAALTGLGLPATAIRTELFAAKAAITPGIAGAPARAPHRPAGPPGTGPEVTFARSGISALFAAGGSGQSLLEFAESCDVPARWSCRTGVCHTCVTPVLSGTFTYSPEPLEAPPGDQALICCARPATDLVLDM